jgi:hypothetical protein
MINKKPILNGIVDGESTIYYSTGKSYQLNEKNGKIIPTKDLKKLLN